jgi:hypothetical protein
MIPAPPGLAARYRYEHKDSPPLVVHKPIVAFNDEGDPLVSGDRGLEPADWRSNFDRVVDDPYPRGVAFVAGGGWVVEYLEGDTVIAIEPIVGWLARTDGTVVPMVTDSTGGVDELDSLADGSYRLVHPDAIYASEAVKIS